MFEVLKRPERSVALFCICPWMYDYHPDVVQHSYWKYNNPFFRFKSVPGPTLNNFFRVNRHNWYNIHHRQQYWMVPRVGWLYRSVPIDRERTPVPIGCAQVVEAFSRYTYLKTQILHVYMGARSKLLAPHLASILTHPQDFHPPTKKSTHTQLVLVLLIQNNQIVHWDSCIWYLRDVWFHGVASSRFTCVLSAAQFPRIPSQGRSRFHRTDVLIQLLYRCSSCNSTTLIFSIAKGQPSEMLIGCKLLYIYIYTYCI